VKHICCALFVTLLLASSPVTAQINRPFVTSETAHQTTQRAAMVKWLAKRVKGITPPILKAFGAVPRHKYMRASDHKKAYKNKWAHIGYGQTITNPWMVAYMTLLLRIERDHKVLEIGTGSGYQGSILQELSDHVYSVEIIRPLAKRTHALLENLGYKKRIKTAVSDGYFGWQENGPYDRIMVTCAADHIPIPLIQQLKPGGLMLVPVGPAFQKGNIYLVTKNSDGSIKRRVVATGTFVPMRRVDVSDK
jgi:protein-L-isoaspartate(D-aspartate) O-methyltransferase